MQDVREYGNDELVALVPLPADDANKYTVPGGRHGDYHLAYAVRSERYPRAAAHRFVRA